MNKFNSILSVFFAILLIIIIGELGYYFFYKPNKPNVRQNIQKPVQQTVNKLTQAPTIPPALDRQELNNLARFKKGGISGATVELEIKGTIVRINTKGGMLNLSYKPGDKFAYKVMFEIKKENGATSTIAYNENDLKKVKVVTTTDGAQKLFDIGSLKINDKIVIRSKIDLMKDRNNNLIEETITKIL